MLDNMQTLLQRGEQIETLQARAVNIRSTAGSIKKKAKKVNQEGFWSRFKGCFCPGVSEETSRGIGLETLGRLKR